MTKSITIKQSKIHKQGVFANKDFKKGDLIMPWEGKIIPNEKINTITKAQKRNCSRYDSNNWIIFSEPCNKVNHSCNPNSVSINHQEIALRDIKKGEEITTNYKDEEA